MKVAIVGPYPAVPGESMAGGIESATAALVAGLREVPGLEVSVVTCSATAARRARRFEDGADVHVLPFDPRRARVTLYLRERAAIARLLRTLRPDVVHVQGQNFYGPAALRADAPVVLTVHAIYYKEARIEDRSSGIGARAGKRLRGWFNTRFERQTLSRTSELIVINPYVLEAVRHLTPARAHHIPNPVDESFFDVDRRPVHGRVLFAGTFEPRKDVRLLVRAFARVRSGVPHATLHLAGRHLDRGYNRSVVAAIRSAGLEDAVRLLGPLPHPRLRDEYARASLLVLASREESSPLVIQQAMAAGVPVLASRAGGIPALVRHARTGWLVPPGEEGPLADAMVGLLRNDALREGLAREARADAEPFRPRAVAARTAALYAGLCRPRQDAGGRAPRVK